jgi:hypothetical protein
MTLNPLTRVEESLNTVSSRLDRVTAELVAMRHDTARVVARLEAGSHRTKIYLAVALVLTLLAALTNLIH